MAVESLHIPEENLEEVIHVIRLGLNQGNISKDISQMLSEWCNEEESYLERLKEE